MKLGMQVGLRHGHIVLDGDTASPPLKGHSPNFRLVSVAANVAAWIKMSLGMEVGLGPGDIVLDGDPLPLHKKGEEPHSPMFGPFLLWPNGWMH